MSSLKTSIFSSLTRFTEALQNSFPKEWKRVDQAYTVPDRLGRTLANVPANIENGERDKAIAQFPTQESASDKYISYQGLDNYLLTVLPDDKKNIVLSNSNRGFDDYHNINVLSSMVEAHPLAKFITQKKPLFAEDFISIVRSNFVDLANLRKLSDQKTISGVLEASQGPSHGDYVWTRDMAAVALGKININQSEFARKITERLLEAYVNPKQRQRINRLIENPKLWETLNAIDDIPHTRFKVEEVRSGSSIERFKLVDCDQAWGMQQLDAYGYFIQLATQLAQKDESFKLGALETNLRDSLGAEAFYQKQGTEATIAALARMLVKIEYWNKADFGAWEFPMHMQRASSIAAVVSGLQSFKNLLDSGKSDMQIGDGSTKALNDFKEVLDLGISKGKEVLFAKRVPDSEAAFATEIDKADSFDSTYKISHKEREKDSALLFALTIADPDLIGLSDNQKKAILKTVYSLMGEVGFKRFLTDEYMGKNWTTQKSKESSHGEHADNTTPDYKAAEWSFFDPYLASYFYKQFLNSQGEDLESYLRADRHARRTLAQITKTNYEFYRKEYMKGDEQVAGQIIKVPAGEVTEHYWISDKDLMTGEKDGKGERYIVGENYRLNWTKIAIQEMMHFGSLAGQVFKDKYPNKWDQFDVVGLSLSSLGKQKNVSRRAIP